MTITYSTVTQRTGVTYTSLGKPISQEQVTAFITACKGIFQGYYGTAVDETDQAQVEIVLDMVETMLDNHKNIQRETGDQQLAFPPRSPKKVLDEDVKIKIGLLTISKMVIA